MNKKAIVVSLGLVGLILMIPFNTTVVPEWKIHLIDENGNPYRRHLVREFCTNYTLGIHPCETANDTMQLTDDDGYVVFPERKINASLLSRVGRTAFHFVFQFAHGGYGVQISVDSSGPQGYKTLEYKPGESLPTEFVLPTESGGLEK